MLKAVGKITEELKIHFQWTRTRVRRRRLPDVRDPGQDWRRLGIPARTCTEGPVFDAGESFMGDREINFRLRIFKLF